MKTKLKIKIELKKKMETKLKKFIVDQNCH